MKKFLIFLIIACLQLSSVAAAQVVSDEQRRVLRSGIGYFNTARDCVNGPVKDPEDTPCTCSVGIATDLNGNDNQQKAFNFFVQPPAGLTPEQSAAIVGNLMQESGVNPTARNPSSGAYGIAQWLGGRYTALQDFASSHGGNADDLGTQLSFLWYEVTEGGEKVYGAVDALKAAGSLEQMVEAWETKFERADPSEANMPKRIEYARKVLQLYGGGVGANTVSPGGTSAGSCAGITGPGEDSKYVDGFLVYSQYDPAWKDKPYSTSTIGASGCGPAAMAMIITALTGQAVTPPMTADYAASQNLYVPGAGSSWAIGPVLAEHWGLKSQQIGADISKITATLQAGGLVITAGQGPKPFTSGGHFIVIRAVTADGKFKVGDSGHSDTSDQEWDPQQLISSMADGSVYAITK